MKKKKIIIGILACLLLLQLYPSNKNNSNEEQYSIHKKFPTPSHITTILQKACNDCHSNNTKYPSYASVQPIAMWMHNHIEEGKHHLNFSTFLQKKAAIQYHKLEEIIEQINEDVMPLSSYTMFGMHKEANLTKEEKQQVVEWATNCMDSMKAWYPSDSLVLKKRN